ncbi:protein GVQW3-like [Oratosquilla oratoria]|uniref:protein GVQW3-like n=1 Tax=Oratosquilla oratoria TaxID=337810 RepID=UPI003F7687B8
MTQRLEQRHCIKFCQKLGDSQMETIRKIQTVFGDDHITVESEPRSGRPSQCQNDQVIAKVYAVVMRDCRVTIRKIAEEVVISPFLAHSFVTEDLAMKRVAAKFVPKLLTVEEEQVSVEVTQDMLDSANSDPDFMKSIITGDES